MIIVHSRFAVNLSAPDDDCDILLQPIYSAPFLFCVFPYLPAITLMRKRRKTITTHEMG